MKKLIVLFTLLILFTGCETKNITSDEISKVVDESLKLRVQGSNNYFKGYKYYIPRGFVLENVKDNNHTLFSNGDYYYLYIDVVSYFHKEDITTTFDNELYFSQKISYNGNDGYIKISKQSDEIYFIEIVYNYSKIEAYIKSENLSYAVSNSIKILASIKYNSVILDTIIGEKTSDDHEEIYNFFEPKREEGNFLDYIEEYDVYDKEDKIKDEDVLDSIDE